MMTDHHNPNGDQMPKHQDPMDDGSGEPPRPPSESLAEPEGWRERHSCFAPGVPADIPDELIGMDPVEDNLKTVIAQEGSRRVLFAAMRFRWGLSKKIESIAEANMEPAAFLEFKDYFGAFDDFQIGYVNMIKDVTCELMLESPDDLGTLEEMIRGSLVASGYCCQEAVDHYVEGEIGHGLSRLPGFRPEWLTLRFALAKEGLAFE